MASLINSTTLTKLRVYDEFNLFVRKMYEEFLQGTELRIEFSDNNIRNAWEFWISDIEGLEPQVNGMPCHFKECAFLTFWLRREPPVAIWDDSKSYLDADVKRTRNTDFIGMYGREWFAFRLGYEILLYRECNTKNGGPFSPTKFSLNQKLIADTCYFLKKKSVSPHALYLTFYSIFMDANPKLGN